MVIINTEEFTSKCCNVCGELNSKLGSNEVFKCPNCGASFGRDDNGSLNIMLKLITEILLKERPISAIDELINNTIIRIKNIEEVFLNNFNLLHDENNYNEVEKIHNFYNNLKYEETNTVLKNNTALIEEGLC